MIWMLMMLHLNLKEKNPLLDNLECLDNLVCREEILAWLYLKVRLVPPATQQTRLNRDNLLLEEPLIVHNLPVLQEQHAKPQLVLHNLLLEEPLIAHSLPALQGQRAKPQQRGSSLTFELVA